MNLPLNYERVNYCNWTQFNCSSNPLYHQNKSANLFAESDQPQFENLSMDYNLYSTTTTTLNISTANLRLLHQHHLSAACYTAATTICAISSLLSLSNFLVIWVVLKTPFLRSKAVNMLIVNLCFIDLVASCIDLPLIWTILHVKFSRRQNYKWICNWYVRCVNLELQVN